MGEGQQLMDIIRPGLTSRTFEASDQDTVSSSYQYFGFLTQDGNWVIQRFDLTVSNIITYRYATVSNNAGYEAYTAAWAARTSLTYNYWNVVRP